MKIEPISSTTFANVEEGECFREKNGSNLFMRIEVDHELTHVPDEEEDSRYGLAINLLDGVVTWFYKTDLVEKVDAKIVC